MRFNFAGHLRLRRGQRRSDPGSGRGHRRRQRRSGHRRPWLVGRRPRQLPGHQRAWSQQLGRLLCRHRRRIARPWNRSRRRRPQRSPSSENLMPLIPKAMNAQFYFLGNL